ncbi:enoyl-CoA hydratase family protein [Nocardioides allogilvus]|uniref:enoyl-CoA hydratase family protein n=1 Tax=Nocardioides allogilvus TaxID=2072017 RepID=UPI002FCDB3D8
MELVHYVVDGPLATITLDSPHNRNALSKQLVTELFGHLQAAAADDEVRVVLITSSGKVFCSGADLSEATADGMEEGARRIVELQRLIVSMDKPVVVRAYGAVRAGGIGIVAAADIAVANESATFALTEVKLGLAAAIISLTVHHRMDPRAAALTTLGGEVFSGADAAAYGLVTTAVPDDAIDERVAELCRSLATGAPQGLRESKRILNADLIARIDAKGAEMAALSARLFASDEARESMTAFLSRKK